MIDKNKLENDLRFYNDMLDVKKKLYKEQNSFSLLIMGAQIVCLIFMMISKIKINIFTIFVVSVASFSMCRCLERLTMGIMEHRSDVRGILDTIDTIENMMKESDKYDLL